MLLAGLSTHSRVVAADGVKLKVGFAERDITPEVGMEKPGGYGKSYIQSIHDPCKVRASVFDDGSSKVAIVGIDALTAPEYLVSAARDGIAKRCGIERYSVMIAGSHSHSSGPIGMFRHGDYDHASEFVQKLAYEHSTVDDAVYADKVVAAIVDAVCAAHDGREAMDVGVGKMLAEDVAYNRRFRMKNGLTYTHPGQGNPDIVAPAGPTDPEVGVVGAWDAEGNLKGAIVNFACHGTASGPGSSANWIYYMEQAIRGVLGKDVVVVFTPGFSGNVTQVDNLSPYARESGDDQSRFVGGNVGAEAVRALLSMHAGPTGPVAAKHAIFEIARRKPSPEKVRRAYELAKKSPEEVGSTDWTFAKETVMLDALLKKAPKVNCEVQTIQIGPAVFAGAGGEIFVEFGLRLKQESAFPFVFPVSFANMSLGYVPTERALGSNGGGYETRLSSYTNLVPDAGTRMTDHLVALMASMKPGPIPEPGPALPFNPDPNSSGSKPWSYGNQPPEVQ
ncbi:MAG: hypothetical protein GC160_14190 [Acidobacteria bacterium]|nr:hypothetical protein [Acidobacteriota bacterium]